MMLAMHAVTAVSDAGVLGEIPLFRGIPLERLKRLNEVMHRKTVPAGTNMITAEQPGEVVYVLLEGTVKILIEQMDGREVIPVSYTHLTLPTILLV